jgi:hypothetical protein
VNAAGASVWSRLLGWLDHDEPADKYMRLKRAPVATDVTHELQPLFNGNKLSPLLADAAFEQVAHRMRASRLLFVPALLSGVALSASRTRLVEYLTHLVRHFRDEGFDAEIAGIDPGASVEANGEQLANILARHHCPTWIVTHSKGGVDTLQALVTRLDARRFVEGWVAFQSPFLGSPIADVACGGQRARKISGAALRLFGANLDAICGLRTDVRSHYMDEHAVEIARVVHDVPVMCVRSTLSSFGWPTGRWMKDLGLPNDGLVPVNSMVLPGARYVTLEGLGHGEVATRHILQRQRTENADLLKALFAIMLRGSGRRGRAVA